MLVSLKWLKDYVDIDLTADELAHRLPWLVWRWTRSKLSVRSFAVLLSLKFYP